MQRPEYWNHNLAYAPWVAKRLTGCSGVLDVGCGDGTLLAFLDDGTRTLTGIDPDGGCIRRATERCASAEFTCAGFEDYAPGRTFDAILFVASLHHMEMEAALSKAKSLLDPGGKLLVVGLSRPSTVWDWLLEGLRVLPCLLISRAKRMHSSESEQIPVSYALPKLNAVRAAVKSLLPGAKLRQGLYYRYLLEWTKPD